MTEAAVPVVVAMWRYPVKSMQGCRVGADGIVLAADGSSAARVGTRAADDVLAALTDGTVVTGPTMAAEGRGSLRVAIPLRDARGTPSGVMTGVVAGDGALGRATAALATDVASPRLVWRDGTVLGADGRFDRDLSLRAPAQLAAEGGADASPRRPAPGS